MYFLTISQVSMSYYIASVGLANGNHDLQCNSTWSSGNTLVYSAEGLRFKSRAGQMGCSVAKGSPPL